jgi:hypothetical protein
MEQAAKNTKRRGWGIRFFVFITPAIKELNFRHSGESRNPLRRLDAGSSPA